MKSGRAVADQTDTAGITANIAKAEINLIPDRWPNDLTIAIEKNTEPQKASTVSPGFRWKYLEQYDTWSIVAVAFDQYDWRLLIMPCHEPTDVQVKDKAAFEAKLDAERAARWEAFKAKVKADQNDRPGNQTT